MGPGLEITVDKARKVAQENAADGHLFVWEAPGLSEAGTWTPVAMAAIVRELSNAMSISKVYTPPEYVGRPRPGAQFGGSSFSSRWMRQRQHSLSRWAQNSGRGALP
jgi:hypothetical protein